jgi:hypothetical protein
MNRAVFRAVLLIAAVGCFALSLIGFNPGFDLVILGLACFAGSFLA